MFTIRSQLLWPVRMETLAAFKPSDVAVSLMFPVCPALERIMARQRPLKALRSSDGNDVKSVGSPLSVATISPGPGNFKMYRVVRAGHHQTVFVFHR